MYKLVIKGQIVGVSNYLDFLHKARLKFGGQIKPFQEIKKGNSNEQRNNQTVFNSANK